MADNTTLPTGGGGDTISTEDIGGGVKLSRCKIALGAHAVDGGNVTAGNPFPTTSATIGVTGAAMPTSCTGMGASDGTNLQALRASAAAPVGSEMALIVRAIANISSTPTQTSVASSASNVTLLATNTARKGATFFNDSTQVLYLKLGAVASVTSYTVQLVASAYYEVPFGYAGQIDGIWASANGNARITELA